jgi:hypothetical protein
MPKIQPSFMGATKAAVAAAKNSDGASGAQLTEHEWKQIERAVQRDLGDALFSSFGGVASSDPGVMKAAAEAAAAQGRFMLARTNVAAEGIHQALSSMGPQTARVVEEWLGGKRDVRPSDAQLGKLLALVESAQSQWAQRVAEASARAARIGAPASSREVERGHVALARASAGFTLGDE